MSDEWEIADDEYMSYLQEIRDLFDDWLSDQNNLLEIGMHEALGNAFFEAFKKGREYEINRHKFK